MKALTAKNRRYIGSLMSGVGRSMHLAQKATIRAEREQNRRNAREQEKRREQEVREQKLDGILADVVQGLGNIIELGRTKEINKLVAARGSIGKTTPLFEIIYERTVVSIYFTEKSVELFIYTKVVSPVQSVDEYTSYMDCELTRVYPLDSKKVIGPGWFWHIFHNDFTSLWFEEHLKEVVPADRSKDEYMWVSKGNLAALQKLNLGEVDLSSDVGLVGWVLLRFLADCKSPKRLSDHLTKALKKLD